MESWLTTSNPKLKVSSDGRLLYEDVVYVVPEDLPANNYWRLTFDGVEYHTHLLVLNTFKPNENKSLIGNHIDGDKHNNRLDNLEWVTHSGNLIHAYENGLRVDNNVTTVKDLELGVVTVLNTQKKAAELIGVSTERLCTWLGSKRDNVLNTKYVAWRENEVPSHLTYKDVGKVVNGSPRPVLLYKASTGKLFSVDSLARAADVVKTSTYIISKECRSSKDILTSSGVNGWSFCFLSDYDGSLGEPSAHIGTGYKAPPVGRRKPLKVEVRDIESDTTEVFNSITEFIGKYNLSDSGTRRSVYLGRLIRNRFNARYIK